MPFKFTVGQMRTTTSVSLDQQCGYAMLEKTPISTIFKSNHAVRGGGAVNAPLYEQTDHSSAWLSTR